MLMVRIAIQTNEHDEEQPKSLFIWFTQVHFYEQIYQITRHYNNQTLLPN